VPAFDLFAAEKGEYMAGKARKRTKLSYSSFKRIQQCKAMYAMANILYWIPKTVDNRSFCLGSVGHSCMERWIKEGHLQPGFMETIARDEFDKYLRQNTVIPINSGDLAQMRAKSVTNAKALEDTFVEFGLLDKEISSEKKWEIPFPDEPSFLLMGTLDLLVHDAPKVILDLKMTKSAAFMDEDQLILYAMMGVLSGYKTTKAGFIVPLRKEKVVTKTFEAADFKAMLARLRDEVENIKRGLETGKWEYNYNKTACYRCQVNELCAEYRRRGTGPDAPVVDHGNGKVIKFS
jgi:hypothetical protein